MKLVYQPRPKLFAEEICHQAGWSPTLRAQVYVKIAVATLRESILNRLRLVGKNLVESLLETLKIFRDDAAKSGYTL